MKRALLLTLAALTFLAFALPARQAQAAVSLGFSISTGGRHNGFSLSFQSRPTMVVIPSSRVYYDPDLDQDLYCYGGDWYYVDDGGAWYTSRSYRGPFIQVSFGSVPYEVRNVPGGYRRHWGGGYSTSSYGYGYRDRQSNDRYQTPYRDRSWTDRNQTQERDRTWSQTQDRSQAQDRNWNDQGQWQDRDRSWSDRNQTQDRGGNQGRDRGRRNNGNRGGNGHGRWNHGT